MKLSLNDLNDGHVYLGDKLNVRTIFNFDEDSSILWSGIRLLTHPPCLKVNPSSMLKRASDNQRRDFF